MPADKIVSQLSKSDILSVLPTGFLIFTVVFASYVVCANRTGHSTTSLWSILQTLAENMQAKPALIVFIIGASYLLGSVFRAIPVYWAEKTIPPFTATFPHYAALKELEETLNENLNATKHDKSKVPVIGENVPMQVFNYWKDVLCIGNPTGFEYYQTFENRVRLFTGMIWTAWAGILGSILIFFTFGSLLHPTGGPLFLLSLILLLAFGANFRRVRRQEARGLFLIYVAYLQKEATQATSPASKINNPSNDDKN